MRLLRSLIPYQRDVPQVLCHLRRLIRDYTMQTPLDLPTCPAMWAAAVVAGETCSAAEVASCSSTWAWQAVAGTC